MAFPIGLIAGLASQLLSRRNGPQDPPKGDRDYSMYMPGMENTANVSSGSISDFSEADKKSIFETGDKPKGPSFGYRNPWLAGLSFAGPVANIARGLFEKNNTVGPTVTNNRAISYVPDEVDMSANLAANRRAFTGGAKALTRTGLPGTASYMNALLGATTQANNQVYQTKGLREDQLALGKAGIQSTVDRMDTAYREQHRQDWMGGEAYLDNLVGAGINDLGAGFGNLYRLKSQQYADAFGMGALSKGYGGNTGVDTRLEAMLADFLKRFQSNQSNGQ